METTIIELEKKYWQGMGNHQYDVVKNLTYFPCVLASKNGANTVDEATFKSMFESGKGDNVKVKNISDIHVQVISEETVVIAYRIDLEVLDGKQKPPVQCVCSSTWVKIEGKWLCAHHTEAELANQQN